MTRESILDEALRLVDVGRAQDLPIRLLGGMAVRALVPDWRARADRPGRDIDLATNQASRRAVAAMLEAEGYTPDKRFNGANGHKQLYFVDVERSRPVDVLIDRMEMCHTFEFAGDLAGPGPALPVADLLLSKLQIVKINRKDILDALMLFAEFPLVDAPGDGIDVGRILSYTSADWGWWRTVTGNLGLMTAFISHELAPDDLDLGRPSRFDPSTQIAGLGSRIADAPKSLSWRLRAKVGERVPWYEEPEEEAHD